MVADVQAIRCREISHRREFGKLLKFRGLMRYAAEVGTHRGEFAAEFYAGWQGERLYCVDPWKNPPGYNDPAGHGDRDLDLQAARERLASEIAARKVWLLIDRSIEASKRFPAEYFDFVYIDADHRREQVLADCLAWWPLVRRGGILAGHDWFGEWKSNVRAGVVDFCVAAGLNAVNYFPDDDGAGSWFLTKE